MLILDKDDLNFITEIQCLLVHPVNDEFYLSISTILFTSSSFNAIIFKTQQDIDTQAILNTFKHIEFKNRILPDKFDFLKLVRIIKT